MIVYCEPTWTETVTPNRSSGRSTESYVVDGRTNEEPLLHRLSLQVANARETDGIAVVTSPPQSVATLAYLAGIIDADGCIRVSRNKPYADRASPGYHARVHCRMVERGAIDLLDETFGGHVWTQKANLERGRPLHVWDVSDAKAQIVLEALLPYLRVKRAQAVNALALRAHRVQSRAHRTKVVGQKVMVGQYGQHITTPITCLSDEFIAQCDALWLRSKELNRVGI